MQEYSSLALISFNHTYYLKKTLTLVCFGLLRVERVVFIHVYLFVCICVLMCIVYCMMWQDLNQISEEKVHLSFILSCG